MPHARREFDLSTPTARRRLKPKRNSVPYWRFIAAGRYIGYRPHVGAQHFGTWLARLYVGGEKYLIATLGSADDRAPADGEAALSYRQALDKAQTWCDLQERKAKGLAPRESDSYTVAQCMADYLDWYSAHRKALDSTRLAIGAHILPAFGRRQVVSLTSPQIREWHQWLAKAPARLRSAPGAPPHTRATQGPEGERKRKASANRILTVLKAALNLAYSEGRVASDEAWRRVKPFKGADAARIAYLDQKEAVRLMNVCQPDFRRLARAALLTGCRYGELVALRVGDYLTDSRAIHVRESKSNKARHVYLTEDAAAFFESLAVGRAGAEILLQRADGLSWGKAHQDRRMKDACKLAGIEPAVSFHILRHTYASHYLMGGGSLPALAAQLGHADTRMTSRHYGHLAESWRAQEARRFGPTFGAAKSPAPKARARAAVVSAGSSR
jgi:integrase